jgi:dolichol-phosphate mannosyltransferase
MKTISIIIPSYNEENNINKIFNEIISIISPDYVCEIIFIDDGSTDQTLDNIKLLTKQHPNVRYISFSRNFGHQNALKAGIDHAQGECVISIDADLQHPPILIKQMLEKWQDGFDVVTTKREKDENLSVLKRFSSTFFYKILNWLSDIYIDDGAADFRLIDKKIVELIKKNKENNLFFRGYISWIGFRQFQILYKPNSRYSGKTKYSLKKMISFAINGITSFSIKPLRLSILLGAIFSCFSIIYLIYVIYIGLFTDKSLPGWASLLASVLFLGAANLLTIGILGEYIGKLFIQAKGRPNYIIKELNIKYEREKEKDERN